MLYEIRETDEFKEYMRSLRDPLARAKINIRLKRIAQEGNFGDHHSVGDGVSELRILHGPGYRVYYTIQGQTIVFVLGGGDKSSQQADIKKAKSLLEDKQGERTAISQ